MSKLFKLFLGLIVGVAMVPVATLANSGNTTEKPHIVFSILEHDFGDQISGVSLKYSFVFTNTGNAPLFIEKVKAG